jgi:hypothetical protein
VHPFLLQSLSLPINILQIYYKFVDDDHRNDDVRLNSFVARMPVEAAETIII